jgi:hypothetical protein
MILILAEGANKAAVEALGHRKDARVVGIVSSPELALVPEARVVLRTWTEAAGAGLRAHTE